MRNIVNVKSEHLHHGMVARKQGSRHRLPAFPFYLLLLLFNFLEFLAKNRAERLLLKKHITIFHILLC